MTTTWHPPGAGEWKRDDVHITTAITRFAAATMLPPQLEGFERGFAYYGATLAGFDVELIAGRLYMRPRIAGAPAQKIWRDKPPAKLPGPSKPPPKLVFKLLFKLHPELRRRSKRAAQVWAEKSWREMTRRWHEEIRPAVVARCRELTRVDISALDDAALADHLDAALAHSREMFVNHFTHSAMPGVVVGDLLARVGEWTGASPREVLALLQGASPASRAGADEAKKIAVALRDEPELRATVESSQTASAIIAVLRASKSAAGAAFSEYMEMYELRPIGGLDVYHDLVGDRPDMIVHTIRAALRALEHAEVPPENRAEATRAALRKRVPAEHRDDFDAAFEEARSVYGVRDDDVGVTLWAYGIVVRALREAARRLAARKAAHDSTHVYDAEPAEITALLRGAASPSADELKRRSDERHHFDTLEPPWTLGEAGPMPSSDCFPPAVARMFRGVQAFLTAMFGDEPNAARPTTGAIQGTGVSGGVYEGRARLVRDASDFDRIERGDVLIAKYTSPAYNVLLPLLGAIVTERGGLLSHAAIVAREYGIAGVVDTRDALARIPDGAIVRVDGTAGSVTVVRGPDVAVTAARSVAPVARPPAIKVPVYEPTTDGRVVTLRDATALEFGGKARALAAAVAARLPVPDGVALDADLVARVVAGDAAARENVLAAVGSLPAPWAVRSSAVGEDSAQASFAGQHSTVLGVKPDELFEAIAAVHASGHTDAALAYRARMNVSGAPRMGIVVQTLLRPDISGVMFSRDPSAAAREGRLIEATWGLGEALVAGLVTPDRYRVATDGKVLERAIGEKDIAIEARAEGGTAEVTIGNDRAKAACLDDARIAELAQLATRCEQLFGGPQDLEWAVANGRLHLLQSRPVTTSSAS
jgi:rifampicin phosphotransferase